MHGGDLVAGRLARHGVEFVFTLCGGHISPILAGAKAQGIRVVDVRHEATAVFAADAVARVTGRIGVAAVTAGPGVANSITALKNAQLGQSPLVLIGGAAPTALKGRGALQDIDQRSMIAPHVKFMRCVRRVRDLVPAIDAAVAAARDGVPGPAFVECPVDLLYDEATIRGWYLGAGGQGRSPGERLVRWMLRRHVERLFAPGDEAPAAIVAPGVPEAGERAVRETLAALKRAERPLMVLGSQALACAGEADALASAVHSLGIPVYLSGMARGLLGRASPVQRLHRRREALRESDCVILAGVPCDFRLDYGRAIRRDAVLVAANRSREQARLNRKPRIAALGDAGRFVRELAAAGGDFSRPDWLRRLATRDAEREAEIERQGEAAGDHLNPIALLRAVDRVASDDAVFVADGGDFVSTASYIVRPRSALSWLDPGPFGTLGVGAGFALAAKLCRPRTQVWALLGDGACGYGLAEFDTFVRHGIGLVALVGNDAAWTQIAREQVKLLGDDVATRLARTDYDRVVEGFGADGRQVRSPRDVESALAAACEVAASGRPALVNAWLDPTPFREGSISL